MKNVMWMAILLAACSGSGSDGDGADAGGGDGVGGNTAPTWADAPETVEIGHGQTVVLPAVFDDGEGDAVAATVSSPEAGLEAELDAEMGELSLRASYEIEGDFDIEVEATDAEGASASWTVAVDVRPIRWHDAVQWGNEGPEAREHGAIIVDEAGGRALLIAGSGYQPYLDPLDDAWAYDLEAGDWTDIETKGDGPIVGGSHRVAQIPGEQVAYLHGGYGQDGIVEERLFRVDFSGEDLVIEQIEQENPPPARNLHSFVYQSSKERFVLFGGAGDFILNDTWVMELEGDVAVWEPLAVSDPPTPRYGFFHCFDEASERLVVYSGAQGFMPVEPAHDTWALSLGEDSPEWELLDDGGGDDSPPGRRNGATVCDPTGPRMFVFGGTPDAAITEPGVYALDLRPGLEQWLRLELEGEPPERSSGFGFHDPTADLRHMGFGNTSSAVFTDWAVLGY